MGRAANHRPHDLFWGWTEDRAAAVNIRVRRGKSGRRRTGYRRRAGPARVRKAPQREGRSFLYYIWKRGEAWKGGVRAHRSGNGSRQALSGARPS